jgi:hypothetical protein
MSSSTPRTLAAWLRQLGEQELSDGGAWRSAEHDIGERRAVGADRFVQRSAAPFSAGEAGAVPGGLSIWSVRRPFTVAVGVPWQMSELPNGGCVMSGYRAWRRLSALVVVVGVAVLGLPPVPGGTGAAVAAAGRLSYFAVVVAGSGLSVTVTTSAPQVQVRYRVPVVSISRNGDTRVRIVERSVTLKVKRGTADVRLPLDAISPRARVGTAGWVPISVTPSGPAAMSLSAGDSHSCALLADGTVRCWGANGSGQLGDGTIVPRTVPVTVAGCPASGSWQRLAGARVRCWPMGR